MKLFINNHIKKENNIITDGWLSYAFLDNINSHYYHEVYVHGPNGQFRFCQHNTSHIEKIWNNLKMIINKIYSLIPNNYFILYSKEAEMRYFMSKLINSGIEVKFCEIM